MPMATLLKWAALNKTDLTELADFYEACNATYPTLPLG